MKKLVAFMLCGVMAFSSNIAVFANTNTNYITTQAVEKLVDDDLNDKEKEQISNDIVLFNDIGLDKSHLKSVEVKDDSMMYTFLLNNGVESTTEIKYRDNGDTIIHVEENNCIDDIIFTSDGKIFLDGNEVVVSEAEDDRETIQKNEARSITTNTMDCPKGRPSDYTDYNGTENKKNVELSKKLSSMTTSGLAFILGQVSHFISGKISYKIAQLLVDAFYDSETYGLSYKAKIYNYDGGPEYATIYKKYDTTWYSDINYEGDTTKVTSYRIVEYN